MLDMSAAYCIILSVGVIVGLNLLEAVGLSTTRNKGVCVLLSSASLLLKIGWLL
jgi:hypothetical protein